MRGAAKPDGVTFVEVPSIAAVGSIDNYVQAFAFACYENDE
jgi:hypothetical protein